MVTVTEKILLQRFKKHSKVTKATEGYLKFEPSLHHYFNTFVYSGNEITLKQCDNKTN